MWAWDFAEGSFWAGPSGLWGFDGAAAAVLGMATSIVTALRWLHRYCGVSIDGRVYAPHRPGEESSRGLASVWMLCLWRWMICG